MKRNRWVLVAVLSGIIAILAGIGLITAGTFSLPANTGLASATADPPAASATETILVSPTDAILEEPMPDARDDMVNKLTPEQYNICFEKGTEPPGSGKYYHFDESGEYHCVNCGQLLFKSNTKYDSGSGWPAFWEAAEPGAITKLEDRSHGMVRTEVQCSNCGAHLGHVFEDGPPPTGQRYCINSLALEFEPIPASEVDAPPADEATDTSSR